MTIKTTYLFLLIAAVVAGVWPLAMSAADVASHAAIIETSTSA